MAGTRAYNGRMRKLWSWLGEQDPYIFDASLAAFVLLTSFGELATDDAGGGWPLDALAGILILIGGSALVLRRKDPTGVLLVTALCTNLLFATGRAGGLEVALMIAVYTVVTREDERWLRVAAASAVPMIPISFFFERGSYFTEAMWNAVIAAIVAVIGHNVRLRREKRAQEERTEEAEAGRAVSDERLRIARELHDVVAHAMSIVAVQAGVAAHVIDEQPDEAKRMLENVRVTSHEALDEMRRLLGVLRGGDAALAPAPGLGNVEDLVESVRTSGVPVEVRVGGVPDAVPAGVDLTAYRIVQEALTNVLKHAGPASATVDVQYAPGLVIVEVADDGRGGAVAPTGGHGLLGMRERVAVFGGDLVAGPKPGSGFRVRATLPYGAS